MKKFENRDEWMKHIISQVTSLLLKINSSSFEFIGIGYNDAKLIVLYNDAKYVYEWKYLDENYSLNEIYFDRAAEHDEFIKEVIAFKSLWDSHPSKND